MSVSRFSPASGHDEGDSSAHGRPQIPCCAAVTLVLLPSQLCLPSSCSSFTHWEGNGSSVGRRLFLPSRQPGFTMGMHLLGLALFLWKQCSGRELFPVSQQDCCATPGTVGGPGWLPGPPKPQGPGFAPKEVLGFFILPLQKTSSLENVAQEEPESAVFSNYIV